MISIIAKQILNDLQQHLPTGAEQGSLKAHFKADLEAALEKAGLVSKQEFDAQANILKRTREKISQLEEQITTLEKQINKQ